MPDAQLGDLYISVDKFDKIGADGVRDELLRRGLPEAAISRMMALIQAHRPGLANLDLLDEALSGLPAGQDGLRELRELAAHLAEYGVPADNYDFDFTMVRGLGYYTGPIFETVVTEPNLGSITGGGRYDDLIGLFRKESLPTTGTSLGIERIIDLMDILDLYPPGIGGTVTQVLVAVFDDATRPAATRLAADLRAAGLNTELALDRRGLGKQFQYADRRGIPLVALQGPDEVAQGVVKLKRLADGVEVSVPRAEVPARAREMV